MMVAPVSSKGIAAALLWAACGVALAQEPNCGEVAVMARMARAKSSAALPSLQQKAGDSYRAQVVSAARSLELDSAASRAAVTLLNLIPRDADQQSIWVTLGDSLYSGETVSDMKSLGQLGERLPRGLARAVLLIPDRMQDYLAYSLVSTQDPHSDYAIQMRGVCQTRHSEFLGAVEGLPPDKRGWFTGHVFNPDGCHALALPEAK
jgi:hypothetical protein